MHAVVKVLGFGVCGEAGMKRVSFAIWDVTLERTETLHRVTHVSRDTFHLTDGPNSASGESNGREFDQKMMKRKEKQE